MIAWLYTGPLGHLAAGVLDWVVLLARHRALIPDRVIPDRRDGGSVS